MRNNNLIEKLQVWGFEEGRLIFKDLSLGSVLELSPKDISCKTDDYLNSLKLSQSSFLNSLPENLSLQFVQLTTGGAAQLIDDHKKLTSATASDLSKKLLVGRVEILEKADAKHEIIKQKLYLVIRRNFVNKSFVGKVEKNKPSFLRKILFFIWRKKNTSEEYFSKKILDPELKLFGQLEVDIQKGLDLIGIKSKRLSEDETYAVLYNQWNPEHLVSEGHYNAEDIRDTLIVNDLVVTTKGFMLGQVHHRVLSLKIMPEKTFSTMAEKLRELPFDSMLTLSIAVLDQAKEDFALKTQRRVAYAMYAGKKGVQDLDSAAKLQDIEAILSKRVSGETKIFSVGLNVVLRHQDSDVLESQCSEVLAKFRELSGAEGMLETLAATNIFCDLSLPNARCPERSRRMTTEVLADFLMLYGDWRGHKTPRILLRNRSGGLVGFDPFSSTHTNYNQLISGSSGAGKSFFGNILVSHLMKEAPQVFIIDIGGSYKKTTENFGGQYIPIGADSKISLNPFDLSNQDPEAIDQKIKFLTSLVELMTKEDDEKGIRKLERSEIEILLKNILKEKSSPCLSDLKNKLLSSTETSLVKMGKILEPWCGDSPYGKFIDQKTNLSLDRKIVCFDLKGLEALPDLQAVCLFLITDLIWREIQKDRTSPKYVLFDECWQLLDNDAGAKLIENVFRTFRKYMASAIAISQSIEDFSDSKIAKAIFACASIKWLLKQNTSKREAVQKVLSLNDREMDLIETVTSHKGYFSEAFLLSGDDHQVVKIESTPLEYWLSTTDPTDMTKINEFKDEYSNPMDLLEFLAKKFPHGAFEN